jgi:hypothetical protein
MLKKFETEVNDGINTKAEHKGDGMQRAVMLAIVQAYADFRRERQIARNFTCLFDEAELHIHPTAQRSLKNALRDIVQNGGQVFINSHSSIFANEVFVNQLIYRVDKESGISALKSIATPQEQLDSIYQLLGGSPNDILLPSNFIIVEGQSEFALLSSLIERLYNNNNKCSGLKVIFARGDSEMHKNIYHCIHRCYTPLLTNGVYRTKVVFLLDKVQAGKEKTFQEFKDSHKWLVEGEHLHILPVEAIEMYYPAAHRKALDESQALTGKQKVKLAKDVAHSMQDKEMFKNEMPVVYNALMKAIEFAYE